MKDEPIEIERIVPRPWTEAHVRVAIDGIVPFKLVTLDEYRRQYPSDHELRNISGVEITRTIKRP